MKKPENKLLPSLIIILLFLGAITVANEIGHKKIEQENLCASLKANISSTLMQTLSGKLQAHAVSVYDFTSSKSIYSENSSLPLPLASLTKLMTVRVAMHAVTPETKYTVQKSDITFDGGTGFVPGDTYYVHDLLEAVLIASSNNAAVMLAKSTGQSITHFISMMNNEAVSLGLSSLTYSSVSGLDTEDNKATATGNADDVLKLLYRDTMEMPEIMNLGTKTSDVIHSTSGRSITLTNTDTVLDKLPLLKASKTGYTDVAGGNLAVLWQEQGGDILGAVVLGSTITGRFTDVVTLHDSADSYIEAQRAIPTFCNK